MQRDAALGQRQRLIVMMAHQRHVRLVVDDSREHVVGVNRHGEPFAVAQRGGGFVAAADCARSTADSECTSAR
jgi:hypothetical protein